MQTSEQTNDIAAALALAQADMSPAPKDSTNPHFKSRYADLASCKEAAKPALAKHSLSIIQTICTDFDRQAVGVVTRLTHKSGQWYEGITWCQPRDLAPQSVGAAATYLRRYGFSAIIGLVSEIDDDGETAQGSHTKPAYTPPARAATPGTFSGTKDQQTKIAEILTRNGIPEDDWGQIYERMMGKPSTYISVVLKEYV